MKTLLLNNLQQQAVICTRGPIIIKAGPGTGKTKTLTARIEYLITEKNIPPSSILALTFTRKAAAEMRERLSHLKELPTITTFHAFAYDILHKAGYDVEIISDQDRNEIIQTVIEKKKGKEGTKKDVREISLEISNFKNTFCHAEFISGSFSEEIPDQARNDPGENVLINKYNDQLKLRNKVDYDDLILMLYHEVNKENEKIGTLLTSIEHVLIDEFQDTNRLQYEVIKLFCKPQNLFVIGDPYQSIYSFRGADATIFDQIQTDFPAAVEVTLKDNYRSTKEIILASSALFPELMPLISHTKTQGSIRVVTTCDEYTEAHYILSIINKQVGGIDLLKTNNVSANSLRFSDIAVIYRTHHIGRTLQKIFLDSGIPFQVVGEESPYKKPSIAFMVHLLTYCVRQDDHSLQSILYSSEMKIPKKILRTIRSVQQERNISYHDAVRTTCGQEYVSSKDRNVLSTKVNNIKNIVKSLQNKKIVDVIHMLCEQFQIEQSIDLQQLVSCALQFDGSGGLKSLIQYVEYLEEHEFYDPRADKVTLMTMHAAKGLEFNTVCICGFENGSIPSKNSAEHLEEEKRLLYVALTRAKEQVCLTYPQQRNKEKRGMSIFSEYLSTCSRVEYIQDEAIEKRNKKLDKWKEKKSQLRLF